MKTKFSGSFFDEEKLSRYFAGEDSDYNYIKEIFSRSDRHSRLKEFLWKQFDSIETEDPTNDDDLNKILSNLNYGIIKKERRRAIFYKRVSWVAAIIILPLLIFSGNSFLREKEEKALSSFKIHSPAWTKIEFKLPDGTNGWLNCNSSLEYSSNFLEKRDVTLNGEAYFSVISDSIRPFTVNTNWLSLKVVGTSFNISAYEDESNVEVVLEEGEIIVGDMYSGNKHKMLPDDLLIYDKSLDTFATVQVQPQKYLSWKEGKLVFRNDPLDVICRRISRWYNVDIEVNLEECKDLRLFATFTDENLEEVLDLLEKSLPIEYTIKEGVLEDDKSYTKKKVIINPVSKN